MNLYGISVYFGHQIGSSLGPFLCTLLRCGSFLWYSSLLKHLSFMQRCFSLIGAIALIVLKVRYVTLGLLYQAFTSVKLQEQCSPKLPLGSLVLTLFWALVALFLIYLITVTLGITGLIQFRVLISFDVWHLDVGSTLTGLQQVLLQESSSCFRLRELGSERWKSVWSISLFYCL